MRWIAVILFCAVLSSTLAEPDPKKYKTETKDRNKSANTSLTEDERKFLREVESKFGVKSDIPKEEKKNEESSNNSTSPKAPFPAVIAIEIVNDTDSSTKGKRTIDANLGYGYRTNNGYTYTYFGKQPQEKGKFMIYPYSQEDIPSGHRNSYSSNHHQTEKYKTNVGIQPSHAYELVDVKENQNSYHVNPMANGNHNYENIKGLVSPPPPYSSGEAHYQSSHNPTFYTTYNGQEFSALSGQFPMVMSNYLVDPSQLVKSPQYQSAGINQEYIRSHGSQIDQRVVPVLVLRIPSSYLKKPTAELYANLPNNQHASHYLSNLNLQELVNSYFKKIGYSFAPQVMAYQKSVLSGAAHPSTASSQNYDRENYASPYLHPSYTQADHSGVQYSAVQPVMAKYPTTYSRQHYYVPMSQMMYQKPAQQYEYTYQYVPKTDNQAHYYSQPQYETQTEESYLQNQQPVSHSDSTPGHVEYGIPKQSSSHENIESSAEYNVPETQNTPNYVSGHTQYGNSHQEAQEYAVPKEQAEELHQNHIPSQYDNKVSQFYHSSQAPQEHNIPKETLALYQTQVTHAGSQYNADSSTGSIPSYYYQKQTSEETPGDSLVLSENYPDKDHTLATVLPLSYKRDRKPATVQTVSYVTPTPHKYQSPYKVMVPQTVLQSPETEKVSYVNSHTLPLHQEQSPEAEYTLPSHYSPPIGKQKPPSHPRNYHSHPKRNAKPDNKTEGKSNLQKKLTDLNNSKRKPT